MSSPEGLYKLIEIGVNNYDPQLFLQQKFKIYFFKRQVETSNQDQDLNMPLGRMQLDDAEILRRRIESEIVAMGEFQAEDLVRNAANQADFTDVEPRNT
jgi:hypothetical protein